MTSKPLPSNPNESTILLASSSGSYRLWTGFSTPSLHMIFSEYDPFLVLTSEISFTGISPLHVPQIWVFQMAGDLRGAGYLSPLVLGESDLDT